ncbi:hypothetical protein [Streptomyces sp.]|uniref:hypothetical protein n=1 Tax=Streptomyces sp. TaxID=1931 RepID=UPI002F9527BF
MPDLTLPADVFDVAEIVAREFASHEQHVRDRAAADLKVRAARLRSGPPAPSSPDPVVEALTASCHTEAGRIHASPHLVAAAAYKAVADLLADPASSNEKEETRGRCD